jgi:hypothetical protein
MNRRNRDDLDEADVDFPTRPRLIGCRDRMCGALDCPVCFPLTAHIDAFDDTEEESEP